MKRFYSIDFMKLLFAYIVAFSHFGVTVSPGAGVAVQIFFVISGFFLAKKFYAKSYPNKGKEYNQWDYTKDHVKSLYAHYVFSLAVLAIYTVGEGMMHFFSNPCKENLFNVLRDVYGLLPEIFLVQNAGFFNGGINYPLWQMCTLLISGYFVYALLCFNDKISREIIFPAAIIMIQGMLCSDVDWWGTVVILHVPLCRAFSGLCIGVLAYYFTMTSYYNRIKEKRLLFNIVTIGSLISIFVFNNYHNIYIITSVIMIWGFYDKDSWINKLLNRKIFKYFGDFSYAIYLNHALIINILNTYVFPNFILEKTRVSSCFVKSVTFFAVLTVYSVITMYIVNKYKKDKLFKNYKRKEEFQYGK